MFKRKPHYSLDEFHRYVIDIGIMQKQRIEALQQDREDEVDGLDTNIMIALKVQERLLEKLNDE